MFSLNFWRQAVERAVKTAAQTLAVVFTADQISLVTADWKAIGAMVGTAALLSILTSIATSGLGESDSPSAVAIESAPPEPNL